MRDRLNGDSIVKQCRDTRTGHVIRNGGLVPAARLYEESSLSHRRITSVVSIHLVSIQAVAVCGLSLATQNEMYRLRHHGHRAFELLWPGTRWCSSLRVYRDLRGTVCLRISFSLLGRAQKSYYTYPPW